MKKLNKLCAYFHTTDLYTCPKCHKELRNYMQELRAKVDVVPLDVKQTIINGLHEGLNVGQALDLVDVEREVGYQIISDNIGSIGFLRKEAV